MDAAGYDDTTDFSTRLYDVVDPDALDSLFHDRTKDGRVEFSLEGYEVCAHDDGTVKLVDE